PVAPAAAPPPRPTEPPAAATPPRPPEAAATAAEPGEVQVALARGEAGARIEVRLEPPGLGRVEVALDAAGTRADLVVRAERPETLAALAEDRHALERALREAGLEAGARSFAFLGQNNRPPGRDPAPPPREGGPDRAPAPEARRAAVARSLLDIRI
ncbi:MAG: flagellar hook-length control protein FliK, partial [Acetobacteraceae bacterium]|nr:flagellar hook-length control protein FliK [Acetobacteraceae bacterium]